MISYISSMKQFLLAKNEILLKSVIDLIREIETIKLGIQTKFAAVCWWCVPIQYYPWWFVWNGAMHYHSDTFWITKNICKRKTDQLKVCTRTPVCMAGHFTVSLLQSVGRDWLIVSGYSLPGLKLVRLPLWKFLYWMLGAVWLATNQVYQSVIQGVILFLRLTAGETYKQ